MKFEIYSTSGKMADYIRTLEQNGYEVKSNLYEARIEIVSLVHLYRLTEILGHNIVILPYTTDKSRPAIEIYDDYRE